MCITNERSQPEKAAYRVILTVTFWKRQRYADSGKIRGCWGGGGRDGQGQGTEDLYGDERFS